MKKFLFIYILFFVTTSINAQRLYKISVDNNGVPSTLSFVVREGVTFVSLKEISTLLNAGIYINQESKKIELKFADYRIKFTGRNQYVVVAGRAIDSQDEALFQLPISTMIIGDDVFVPLAYSIDYLSLGYGKVLSFNESAKQLNITSKKYNAATMFVDLFNSGSNSSTKSNEKITGEAGTNSAKTEKNTSANTLETSSKQVAAIPPVQVPVPEPTKNSTNNSGNESKTVSKPSAKSPEALNYNIYGASIEEKANGTMIRFNTSKRINTPRHQISDGKLYLFLTRTTIVPGILSFIEPTGLVKKASLKKSGGNNWQFVFDLNEGYSRSEAFFDVETGDLLVTVHNKLFEGSTNKAEIEEVKTKWIFDAIVIDAGHGGKDPGAIGITGVKEKEINLAIALKLGALIKKNLPAVKVIYTRSTDQFIELYRRGKIANENDGKLFISIHCNSSAQKPSNRKGFEVYLLRPGRTKEAIAIAEFENSVIQYENDPNKYQKLTDENFILVSMAHSQYMRYSEKFSDILNTQWKKGVSNPSYGIKQAGFFVLVGASMPSVLIETGFLSNYEDEAFLKSKKGQEQISKAILESVIKYKAYYDSEVSE
ncbi:MAG: N-acetylmuramoyl-L-alanine amidase [Melioribacteraceae bacterium]|nr:N-acetylmuramoyl-L-alanine amidase [Melioribacteraceae bacterium]